MHRRSIFLCLTLGILCTNEPRKLTRVENSLKDNILFNCQNLKAGAKAGSRVPAAQLGKCGTYSSTVLAVRSERSRGTLVA